MFPRVATIAALLSLVTPSTTADSRPHPPEAMVFARPCVQQPKYLVNWAPPRPSSILCQVVDQGDGFPGDFPPPHFQLPSGYPNREPATMPSPSPTTGTASSSALPRSSSARK
jgi:hypothetical protein